MSVDCFAYARNDKRQHDKIKTKKKSEKEENRERERKKRKKQREREKKEKRKEKQKSKEKETKENNNCPPRGQWRMPKAQILYYWSSRMIFCCTEFA